MLVEDIVVTGVTLNHLMRQLEGKATATLRRCALLDKASTHLVPVQIDYLGFAVPDVFVVGYGIDIDQQYRYLPDIYALEKA